MPPKPFPSAASSWPPTARQAAQRRTYDDVSGSPGLPTSTRAVGSRVGEMRTVNASIDDINRALAAVGCAHPEGRVTAVEAAAELDRLGLLKDSASRPGLPLRNRL